MSVEMKSSRGSAAVARGPETPAAPPPGSRSTHRRGTAVLDKEVFILTDPASGGDTQAAGGSRQEEGAGPFCGSLGISGEAL